MNNSIAVSVQNVSKKYRLFSSPKERLFEALHPFNKKYHHEFWALKDISFDVSKGMTLGIIGQNGSGKSTLLQIICSVLQPTSGTITVDGRISALLELGAGLNPEFTGRQNVLMNGRVVGFSKAEMEERLPLIKAFAEIGEFFDQPVKIYSSGMFVRLAFAAAINVDPDILIVDEALAIGDASFQRKCFRKFSELQEAGKTILLVTHDIQSIVKHCDRAILLQGGGMIFEGQPKEVVHQYLELISDKTHPEGKNSEKEQTEDSFSSEIRAITFPSKKKELTELDLFLRETPREDYCPLRKNYNVNEYRYGDRRAEIVDFLLVSNEQCEPPVVNCDDWIDIYVKVKFYEAVENPNYGLAIKTVDGILLYGTNAAIQNIKRRPIKNSEIVIYKFSVKLSLLSDDCFITLSSADKPTLSPGTPIDRRYDLIHLKVQQTDQCAGLTNLECSLEEFSSIIIP